MKVTKRSTRVQLAKAFSTLRAARKGREYHRPKRVELSDEVMEYAEATMYGSIAAIKKGKLRQVRAKTAFSPHPVFEPVKRKPGSLGLSLYRKKRR